MPIKKISFRERGQGDIVLLLHGYGGSVHHWQQVAEHLSKTHRVVTPNMGHIYLSANKLSFSDQVLVLSKFIKFHFPNKKVHIAGLSYGGAVAWALAHQHPELCEKVALINPMVLDPMKHFLPRNLRFFLGFPFGIRALYFLLSMPMGRSFLKKSAVIFRDERVDGMVAIENLRGRKLLFVAQLIHHFAWVLRSENWQSWNQKLLAGTTGANCRLIYDKEDLLFNEKAYRHFAAQLGCKDIIAITGSGHLSIKTNPVLISKCILDFIVEPIAV